MADDISSWLQSQFQKYNYEPQYVLSVGSDSYTNQSRVLKWPTIRRTANEIKSVKITVPFANDDGSLNDYFEKTYTLVNTVNLQIGDTHPDSNFEGLDLFTGYLHGVKYKNAQCIIEARDRLFDFTEKKIGDTSSVVDIPASGGLVPSEIAWIICTCYGGLSTIGSDTNPDIDFDEFETFAGAFSTDNILIHGRYPGTQAAKALNELGRYTDSSIVLEGDGKIHFKRFTEVDSNDYTWTDDQAIKTEIDVNKRRLVNKQWVSWDYSTLSDYYLGNAFAQDSASVNTFGLHEQVLEAETLWYVDSVSALNIAQRNILLYSEPPKIFKLTTGLDGIWRKIGETARFVDSFFGVTSVDGRRIMEREINLSEGTTRLELTGANALAAFYLDVSCLDGDEYLL